MIVTWKQYEENDGGGYILYPHCNLVTHNEERTAFSVYPSHGKNGLWTAEFGNEEDHFPTQEEAKAHVLAEYVARRME